MELKGDRSQPRNGAGGVCGRIDEPWECVRLRGLVRITEEQASDIEEECRRLKLFTSIDPEHPNAAGVAIVLNKDIANIEGIETWEIIPGRALLAKIPWHADRTITVLAIYAPASSMTENKKFWETLHKAWMTRILPVPDMVLGDRNIVEDAIDRLPHRTDDDEAVVALTRFKDLLGLKDGWRITNPDEKAYTFTSTSGSHSRLDCVMVSSDLFKHSRNWNLSDAPGNLTDHRMVSVDINAPGSPFIGEGRYAIPLFLVKDKKLLEFAVSEGRKLEEAREQNPTDDVQVLYKDYKDKIRTFARERAKEAIGALEQKKIKLQKEREETRWPTKRPGQPPPPNCKKR
ncbi:Endonuclease/exonuclease/phosphatase [Mycena metata]|uniref:Endonuclease/exonuclease/phosphatase n=1 Tax=Mycena metata TaxID=1033252 RepID=A0AAD7MDQ3_9AGAR|nr:Endonuclease/exonuclease/phosphatase [Mycena metata]